MKKRILIMAVIAGLAGAGGAAFADDDDCQVPMDRWQPRAAVQQLAQAQGWQVDRIKIDDGCYEIDGRDAQGRAIEVKLHPGTLRIVEFEFEDEDEGHEREGQKKG